MFFKKKEYTDFVDISIGRVYIKPITHGIKNKIYTQSTMFGNTINNSLFFSLCEYNLLKLSRKKIDNLSIPDGNKVREKIKELLIRYNILEEEKKQTFESDTNIFSRADKAIFERQMQGVKNKFGMK